MGGSIVSRRGFLGGVGSALIAALGGRALAGCGGEDVSVRIRRVDGSVQGSVAAVRASVVLTNRTQVAQTVPVRMTLTVGGTVIGTEEDMVDVAAAGIICWCINMLLPSFRGSMSDATVTITVAEESETASLSTFGADPLRSCDYTCNF